MPHVPQEIGQWLAASASRTEAVLSHAGELASKRVSGVEAGWQVGVCERAVASRLAWAGCLAKEEG